VATTWDFNTERDWAGFIRLGWRFNENWRAEIEGGYRPADIESVRGRGLVNGLCAAGLRRTTANPTCGAPQGELNATTVMFNVLFDVGNGNGFLGQPIVPFLGLGLGRAEVHNKVFGQMATVPTTSAGVPTTAPYQNVSIDDMEQGWAVQGILGASWQLSPNLNIDLTGRWLSVSELEFGALTLVDGAQPRGRPTTPLVLGSFKGQYEDQSISLGLRYTFAAPPPPPPVIVPTPEPVVVPQPMPEPTPQPQPQPEPVRAVAREFVVYFPFDQSVLTPEAQTVVQEAASYAQQGNATQVQVVGHADTSGSARYNVRLSERRARAVADAMVGLGVNPGVITADWRGETQPAVSTGDGVREPLNRRTTINVNF
jgi:outer membrane protein OmpA-like peptidoglycan-associated protein